MTNLDIAALTGLSDKTVGEWRKIVMNAVSTWFLSNSAPIGGPGKIVEVDEANLARGNSTEVLIEKESGCWVVSTKKLDSASLLHNQQTCQLQRESSTDRKAPPWKHSGADDLLHTLHKETLIYVLPILQSCRRSVVDREE